MNYISFVQESNKLEGIDRVATNEELEEMERFISLDEITPVSLMRFLNAYQPMSVFRDRAGMTVMFDGHNPPVGGPGVVAGLNVILGTLQEETPFYTHIEFMHLMPFTYGNGQIARALWAWQMVKFYGGMRKSFKHYFYYQTLESNR